jgi:hypothetical protein
MLITDEKYKLNIISYTPTAASSSFKAYLEDHSVQYQIIEQQLQYAPLSFVNDKVHMRTTQTVSLKFNVFSENLEEAQGNYNKLHKLVEWVKPTYTYRQGQYIANVQNNTGIIGVKFAGLPKIHSTTDELKLHLTTFAFSVNKEMGYIESNYTGSDGNVISGGLIPIAYTLDIGGRILLEFKETARIRGGPETEKEAAQTYTYIQPATIAAYEVATGRRAENLTPASQQALQVNTQKSKDYTDFINTGVLATDDLKSKASKAFEAITFFNSLR